MAAFETLEWRRLDVTAIVTFGGVATLDEPRREACRAWLERQGYQIHTLDGASGLARVLPTLKSDVSVEEQFGYALSLERRNLNALRDGFGYKHRPKAGGCWRSAGRKCSGGRTRSGLWGLSVLPWSTAGGSCGMGSAVFFATDRPGQRFAARSGRLTEQRACRFRSGRR